jgi:hypothetical protein
MNSCQDAFRRMEAEYNARPNYHLPMTPSQTSPGSRKRQLAPGTFPQIPRAIQPKPTHPGEPFSPAEMRPPVAIPRMRDPPTNERPKKRGRPSKADIQARTNRARGGMGDPSGHSALPTPQGRLMPPPMMPPGIRHGHGDAPPLHGGGFQPLQTAGVVHPQQQIETSTSQTEDPDSRRISRPEVGVVPGSPVGITTSSAGNMASTGRPPNLIPPTTTPPIGPTLGPPFRMMNQSTPVSDSPDVTMAHATSLTGPTSADNPRPMPGMEDGKSH